MSKPNRGWGRTLSGGGWSVVLLFACGACGGETKQADSPGNCPEGTVLRGSDCVPPESSGGGGAGGGGGASESSDEPPVKKMQTGKGTASSDEMAWGGASQTSVLPAGKTPYDKDMVEAELKRGSRQVKANCGAATDEEGKASGPFGKATIGITLGRNGHVKQVGLPSEFEGKPAGVCIVHAFDKIQFPPYAGDSDLVVNWEVEVTHPKGH